MTIIDVREISVSLRGRPIFEGASASFEEGKTYGLVGPNGSGKSVLLKLICGFMVPSRGEVWVDPQYLSERRTFPDRFGITIDGPAYLPGISGFENLLELASIRKRIDVRRIRAVMQEFDLEPDSRQRVRNYSLGMKQKLSLAQAVMENPDVLILDEPFNALDSKSAARLNERLRDLRDVGKTIVFTSHDRRDIDRLSDDVWEIDALRLRRAT